MIWDWILSPPLRTMFVLVLCRWFNYFRNKESRDDMHRDLSRGGSAPVASNDYGSFIRSQINEGDDDCVDERQSKTTEIKKTVQHESIGVVRPHNHLKDSNLLAAVTRFPSEGSTCWNDIDCSDFDRNEFLLEDAFHPCTCQCALKATISGADNNVASCSVEVHSKRDLEFAACEGLVSHRSCECAPPCTANVFTRSCMVASCTQASMNNCVTAKNAENDALTECKSADEITCKYKDNCGFITHRQIDDISQDEYDDVYLNCNDVFIEDTNIEDVVIGSLMRFAQVALILFENFALFFYISFQPRNHFCNCLILKQNMPSFSALLSLCSALVSWLRELLQAEHFQKLMHT